MAILYGTTAEGESLPVEVNNLGQLVAEGLPGPDGPPGPPGVGELPPDPVEGDALIWQNGELVWGSVSGGGMQIKKIQRGVVLLGPADPEVFATVATVDPALSLLSLNGFTSDVGSSSPLTVRINLDGATRIYVQKKGGGQSSVFVQFELVEYEQT